MKKKTFLTVLISLMLALSMVLAACDGGNGGNESGGNKEESQDFEVLHPEAPDPATSFTESSSEGGDASSGGDTIYSEAFAAYLKILEDHKDEILGYDWQCGYNGDPALYNKPIAIVEAKDNSRENIYIPG